MSRPLDLKFLYYFSGDGISILEVKINGLPEGTPPNKVYHWLYNEQISQDLQKLDFKSMGTKDNQNYREFEQGELWFDTSKAKLKLQTQEFALKVHAFSSVPESLVLHIQDFLHQNSLE